MKRRLKKDLNLNEGEWYSGTIIGVDELENGSYGPTLKLRVNVSDSDE